jgi:hypothetical protein
MRKEAAANSSTTDSAATPEFSLASIIMPLQVTSAGAIKPSPQAPSSPEIHDPIAEPAGKPYETASTILSSEVDGYTSTATSSPAFTSDPAIAETQDADRTLSVKPKKPIAAPAGTSISNWPSLHGNFNQESARASATLPALPGPGTSFAHRDILLEQRLNSEVPFVHALKPGSPTHERATIEEAVTQSKLDTAISPSHVVLAAVGTQAHAERVGQFAAVPPDLIQVPVDRLAPSANAHPASVREPFTSIDAGAEDTAPKWVSAGVHRAEAGFQDPSLGWVSVRAQFGTGGIHAAVVPSTDVAAQVLGSHLAGLNAHLSSHYEHLNPVSISTPDAGWASRDSQQEMAHGNGGDTSDDGRQQQMQKESESSPIAPVPRSSPGTSDQPKLLAEVQGFATDRNQANGHVFFVV